MSKWTHNICHACWERTHPDQDPVCLRESVPEKCCFCGGKAIHGIYIRHDPTDLLCKGGHDG